MDMPPIGHMDWIGFQNVPEWHSTQSHSLWD